MNKKFIYLILLFLSIQSNIFAQHQEQKQDNDLKIGELILEHVLDSYDWHITKIGQHHISISLPVILFSKEQGLVMFSSHHFHNEHHSYNNFFISQEQGIYKGKIMEKLSDGSVVRPFDISITKNVLALLIFCPLIIILFLSIARRYKKYPYKAPKGIQSFFEPVIVFIKDEVAKEVIGHKYEKFLPFLLTIFFFILINNLMGLVPIFPGGYNLTGNIAVTLVLALFTFVITTINGNKHYWQHIFWSPTVPWWLKAPVPLMPIIEVLSMFIKPFVLMVRLFANILGGHMVMLSFLSLIFIFGKLSPALGFGISWFSVLLAVFDTFLEILVSFIQAYVFTLLSAIYFSMAIEGSHEEEHH